MLRRLTAAAVTLCCLLPATAAGYPGEAVIRDCTDDGVMQKTYTQKQYRDALANMPTDVAQYYGCPDIIKRAQRKAASNNGQGGNGDSGSGTGGGQGSGPTPPTADEQTRAQADIVAAQRGGDQKLADIDVRPGALAYHDFGSVSKLPAPLAVLGLLLLAAAIAVCAYLLRGRVRARSAGA
ncbi:MAG TPA: hypothetical protein VFB41_11390 [Solirubrobacteraceae bacterium]|nr:hypothetical protein [Solirubrobacteraceae bacterium]